MFFKLTSNTASSMDATPIWNWIITVNCSIHVRKTNSGPSACGNGELDSSSVTWMVFQNQTEVHHKLDQNLYTLVISQPIFNLSTLGLLQVHAAELMPYYPCKV